MQTGRSAGLRSRSVLKGRSFSCAVAGLVVFVITRMPSGRRGICFSIFSAASLATGRLQLFRTRVIVNNPPSLRKLAEDQREYSRRLLAVRHHQMKSAAHERRINPERFYLQIAERQRSHRISIGLIPLPIPIQRRLPPFRLRRAGKESQLRRIPVAGHELFQVVTIPRVYLILQNRTNRRVNAGRILLLCRRHRTRNQTEQSLRTLRASIPPATMCPSFASFFWSITWVASV